MLKDRAYWEKVLAKGYEGPLRTYGRRRHGGAAAAAGVAGTANAEANTAIATQKHTRNTRASERGKNVTSKGKLRGVRRRAGNLEEVDCVVLNGQGAREKRMRKIRDTKGSGKIDGENEKRMKERCVWEIGSGDEEVWDEGAGARARARPTGKSKRKASSWRDRNDGDDAAAAGGMVNGKIMTGKRKRERKEKKSTLQEPCEKRIRGAGVRKRGKISRLDEHKEQCKTEGKMQMKPRACSMSHENVGEAEGQTVIVSRMENQRKKEDQEKNSALPDTDESMRIQGIRYHP